MGKISEKLPTKHEFFFNTPLYAYFEIPKTLAPLLYLVVDKLDGYCIYCKRDSIFEIENIGDRLDFMAVPTNSFSKIIIKCTRDTKHQYLFYFIVSDGKIAKIGQFPSVADLQEMKLSKYRNALDAQRYRDFARAIGLSAHGIGIGSFVYLRRVFEDLIEDAYKRAFVVKSVEQSSYEGKKMDEKILALKNFLPPFLVENRTLYGILSKGIHSLTEEECLDYFETVRLGIEMILDQELENKSRIKKLERAKHAISNLHTKLSDSKK